MDGARRRSRGSGTGVGRRARDRRRTERRVVAEQRRQGELWPHLQREARRRWVGGDDRVAHCEDGRASGRGGRRSTGAGSGGRVAAPG